MDHSVLSEPLFHVGFWVLLFFIGRWLYRGWQGHRDLQDSIEAERRFGDFLPLAHGIAPEAETVAGDPGPDGAGSVVRQKPVPTMTEQLLKETLRTDLSPEEIQRLCARIDTEIGSEHETEPTPPLEELLKDVDDLLDLTEKEAQHSPLTPEETERLRVLGERFGSDQ